MSGNLTLLALVAVLYAAGAYLLLERSLTRVLLGVLLLGNATNLLILSSGPAGGAPIVGAGPQRQMSDPLAQAMILTAIVITLGLTAFLLALVYRSWELGRDRTDEADRADRAGAATGAVLDDTADDDVVDDEEDRLVVSRAAADRAETDRRGTP